MEQDWAQFFDPRPLDENQAQVLTGVRGAFKELAVHLQSALPAGRYKSLVLTELEKVAMVATKVISHT